MSKDDFTRMGEEIKKSVEKAVDSIPYEKIGKRVSEKVDWAGEKIREEFEKDTWGRRASEKKNYHIKPPLKNKGEKSSGEKRPYQDMAWQNVAWQSGNAQANRPGRTEKNAQLIEIFARKPKGRIVWVFFLLMGLFLTCLSGFSLLLMTLANLFSYGYLDFSLSAIPAALFLLGIGSGIFLMFRGNIIHKRLQRFKIYKQRLTGKEYCQLDALSKATGKSPRYLKKDLGKMISLGMFPQGHLDEQGTCLMLTSSAYEQYLLMVESQQQKAQESAKAEAQKSQEEKKKKG